MIKFSCNCLDTVGADMFLVNAFFKYKNSIWIQSQNKMMIHVYAFMSAVPKLWSSIPNEIRNAKSVDRFIKEIVKDTPL